MIKHRFIPRDGAAFWLHITGKPKQIMVDVPSQEKRGTFARQDVAHGVVDYVEVLEEAEPVEEPAAEGAA